MPDIATTDNQLLATAAQAAGALTHLAQRRKWLDDATARLLYKFAEERPPATIADIPNPP